MLEEFTFGPEMIPPIQGDLVQIATYGVLMVVYGIIVWHYYRNLAKRDILHTTEEKGYSLGVKLKNFLKKFSVFVGYIVAFPLITVIWFGILFFFILLLGKARPIEGLIAISVAIIFATRIAAYYKEDLARDMAKLIPFALLGVFIVDPSYFSIDLAIERIYSLPGFVIQLLEAVVLLVVLEWVLRILYIIKKKIFGSKEIKEVVKELVRVDAPE